MFNFAQTLYDMNFIATRHLVQNILQPLNELLSLIDLVCPTLFQTRTSSSYCMESSQSKVKSYFEILPFSLQKHTSFSLKSFNFKKD